MKSTPIVSDGIANKIYFLRGERVIPDMDLATLYSVENKRLKESVRRNRNRFPEDFMFQLSGEEWINLRSQIASSSLTTRKKGWGGLRYPPFAFTEQGVAMLSGLLNSPRAIETNIAIMRTFVALRKWMQSNRELAEKIRKLESKYDEQFKVVFEAIRQTDQRRKRGQANWVSITFEYIAEINYPDH